HFRSAIATARQLRSSIALLAPPALTMGLVPSAARGSASPAPQRVTQQEQLCEAVMPTDKLTLSSRTAPRPAASVRTTPVLTCSAHPTRAFAQRICSYNAVARALSLPRFKPVPRVPFVMQKKGAVLPTRVRRRAPAATETSWSSATRLARAFLMPRWTVPKTERTASEVCAEVSYASQTPTTARAATLTVVRKMGRAKSSATIVPPVSIARRVPASPPAVHLRRPPALANSRAYVTPRAREWIRAVARTARPKRTWPATEETALT